MNNVVLRTLFNVVNNTEVVVEPESSLQSGVTMLNNIVDSIEHYGRHNIVQSCFHSTTRYFLPCTNFPAKATLKFYYEDNAYALSRYEITIDQWNI